MCGTRKRTRNWNWITITDRTTDSTGNTSEEFNQTAAMKEEKTCWNCSSECNDDDKFCRQCGEKFPAQVITWDWRGQPCFGSINERLKPFGVQIVEVETNTDQHGIRVEALSTKGVKP